MKKYILLGLALLIIAVVLTVRLNYYKNLREFKDNISAYENSLIQEFEKNKDEKLNILATKYPVISEMLLENYSTTDALLKKDTIFNYYYLSDKITYHIPIEGYYDYLCTDCMNILNEIKSQKEIAKQKNELRKKYISYYDYWDDRLAGELIDTIIYDNKELNHIKKYLSYNKDKWDDFRTLLKKYQKDRELFSYQNKQTEIQYNNLYNSYRKKFEKNSQIDFDERINEDKSRILISSVTEKSITTSSFGEQIYPVSNIALDKDVLESIFEEEYSKQWKNYQLPNGATPYSNCYGRNNYYSGWNCSQISVSSGNYDVVIIIKNSIGKVIRHAYIQAYHSFTFNIPNGSYQTFFYSGSGWNPYKATNSSKCTLHGGFVDNESFGKDDYFSISDQILTYRLTYSSGGNFSMRGASKNEMF